MNAVETLARFFQAENDRDWEEYRTFLHEDVVWHLHGEGDRTIRGVEEYMRTIRDAYAGSDARFCVEEAHEAARGSRVVVLLVDDSGKRSFEVFDFEDGLIRREHEFLLG
ncbi:nuclear transport factor 2 family protein [Schaalia georgiae]|nr:nuclear transport factor 2 family protein [Schaalia georgiae]